MPLFLSEIAPTRIRGGLNILFQLNVTIGILFASLVNYGTAKYACPSNPPISGIYISDRFLQLIN